MKNKSLIAVLAVLVAVIALAAVFYPRLADLANETTIKTETDENGSTSSSVSDTVQYMKAKDITVFDKDGKEVKLSDSFGKPIILNFWATWCTYCIQEMPDFQKMYEEYDDEIEFFMINTDESIETGNSFIESKNFTFPVYYDLEYSGAINYPTRGIPYTVAIDKDGNIIYSRAAMIDENTLKSIIEAIK